MARLQSRVVLVSLTIWSLGVWGCNPAREKSTSGSDETKADSGAKPTSDDRSKDDSANGDTAKVPNGSKPDVGGNKPNAGASKDNAGESLLEPFDPPPLAEIDAKAEWIDQEVADGLKLLKKLESEEPPLVSVDAALKLKNDSTAANKSILGALGRMPKNDAEVDWEATINGHLPADLKSTNPIMVSSTYEFEVADLTSIGLFAFDWTMRAFAAESAVEKWQTSKDRMYDKIVLRKDITWSDGHPFTAKDVVFTFQTIMNPKVPVPSVRSGTDKLRWVEAYDAYTLVFFHKESLATNIWNINFPIIPKHIYEKSIQDDLTLQDSKYHVQYENDPVTSGAYTIASRKRGQEIVLARRESYYMHNGKQVRDKPFFKTIRFRIIEDSNTALLALKSGEIEEMQLTPEQWTTQTVNDEYYSRNTKATGMEWVSFGFNWNLKTPFFSDVRVRKAMGYAFNHDEMLEKLCYGLYEPSNGIFHSTAWMAPKNPPKPYKQDLAKAEQLLDEAGWEDHDGDGIRDQEINGESVPFEFTMLCPNIPDRIAICTLMKENLDQIGIICNVRPTEFTVMSQQMLEKKFQASFGGWGTGTDPDTSDNIWSTGQPRNYTSYSNPEVDKLYELGRKEFDKAKRAEIYGKIHLLLYEDQPYTWLYFRNSFYGFNKQLRGYRFSPRGPYNYSPGFSGLWKVAQ